MADLSIFLANKSNPNVGEWVNLPDYGLEEIVNRLSAGNDEERMARIEEGDEEGDGVVITDSDGFPFKVKEDDDLDELNEFAELVEDAHDEDEILAVAQVKSEQYYNRTDLDDIIHCIRNNNYTYYSGNLADVAETLVDEGIFGEASDYLKRHIDYEAIGNDLRHDGYEYVEGRHCVVQLHD